MKLTLVLCVLALIVAVVFGSGGHDAGHGDAHATDGHGDGHGGAHADAGHGDAGHGAGHADEGHGNSATSIQMCSTLFSFAVIAALNKL